MAGTLAAALDRVVKFVDDALWSALLAQEALELGRDLVARGRRELHVGGVVVGLLLELVEHGEVLRVLDDQLVQAGQRGGNARRPVAYREVQAGQGVGRHQQGQAQGRGSGKGRVRPYRKLSEGEG